jgi:predicted nucleotidyltransferase
VVAELPRKAADDLLARLDRAAPGRIEGFYVVGSAAMGAFRPGRSDVDFVAIVDGDLRPAELLRLGALHSAAWASALVRDTVVRRRWPLVCNGVYLKTGDLSRSPLEITPLAGHVAGRFRVASRDGFDVSPVTWHVLAHHGVALRGPDRDRLQIHGDDAELRTWVLANLNGYWRRWVQRRRGVSIRAVSPRRLAASGVLGAPRLHYTVATGEITTKEAAAEYSLEVFGARWHALVEDAVAYWRGEPPSPPYRRHPQRRYRDAVDFVAGVIDAANRLTAPVGSAGARGAGRRAKRGPGSP